MSKKTAEGKRLEENREKVRHWSRWGPYLTERQWGTVREDYSADGSAWKNFPYEQAPFRAYRWGEDGIGGISDNHQRVCFAPAFWNGKDPILKERLFGLAGGEGNHGEDIKEYYFYLDNTPTHSYMKYLYKYPHEKFPEFELRKEAMARGTKEPEYELLETGVFQDSDYYDIFIEYAKANDEDDLLINIHIFNRSKEKGKIHVLPTVWFRNTWSWGRAEKNMSLKYQDNKIEIDHPTLGKRYLYFEDGPELLFTENETNNKKLYGEKNKTPFVKDSFHEYIIHDRKDAVNPEMVGTKAAVHHILELEEKKDHSIRLRLTKEPSLSTPFKQFNSLMKQRQKEADEFYNSFQPENLSEDRRGIQRQAFAGLLWSKQFYHFVVEEWLEGDDPKQPPPESRKRGRNSNWIHVYNDDILSVPDKWEYPWFASWDTAFHTIPLAIVDPEFAKKQLTLLTREWYMHPNGQIPSYEWNFSDVNPPVQAWAAWRIYKIEQKKFGREDKTFLASIFQKLLLYFTWWVNRKDAEGKNVFHGGFLGLDNVSIFNRSDELPLGGSLTQSDATSWMGMFCLNMWTIAMELAKTDSSYEDMASKFFEHFLYIADAINYSRKRDMPTLWNEEEGFYFDLLHSVDGSHMHLKIHSIVGLIPLLAVATLEEDQLDRMKGFKRRFEWFLNNRHDLCQEVASLRKVGVHHRRILSLVNQDQLKKISSKMLDEKEFFSPHGIRSLSLFHKDNPFVLPCGDHSLQISYEPGESTEALFGGNSNWRGPVWFPLNFLLIEALQKFHHYYGDEFKVECPTGSGNMVTLWDAAGEIARRLITLFERDEEGNRPFDGEVVTFQKDPLWKNYILFNEYFDGDTGKGLGANHQTGWTALVAKLIQQYGESGEH